MTVIIDRTTDRVAFGKILQKMYKPKKKFDANAFCGKISFNKDPLTLQKLWRDEW